jgi:hypothetical protein
MYGRNSVSHGIATTSSLSVLIFLLGLRRCPLPDERLRQLTFYPRADGW